MLVGVAVATLALRLFQTLRADAQLEFGDFQNALFAAAVLMTFAVISMQRLPRDAGAERSRRQ